MPRVGNLKPNQTPEYTGIPKAYILRVNWNKPIPQEGPQRKVANLDLSTDRAGSFFSRELISKTWQLTKLAI